MKQRTKDVLTAIVLGAVVPLLFYQIVRRHLERIPQQDDNIPTTQQEPTAEDPQQPIPVMHSDGTVVQMELDRYLVGVVSAEMPAEFEPEALKAQAIVARTYALKRVTTDHKHPQNAVCTDASCCQAYRTQADFLASGADTALLDKVYAAVMETTGQVLTYNGALIEATYFSCSGGRTEDAQAVWGAQIPYLQSVESPGEENAAHYVDTVSFSADMFCERLGTQLTGAPSSWIGEATYTSGGGVASVVIGDHEYAGTTVRQLLGLRSTAFMITAVGDTVTVTTKGYGHRVGMSQYGAEAMAVDGSTAAQILAHYYPGTTLQLWQGD